MAEDSSDNSLAFFRGLCCVPLLTTKAQRHQEARSKRQEEWRSGRRPDRASPRVFVSDPRIEEWVEIEAH